VYAAIVSILLLAVLLAAFVDGRWRYDVVALIGLVAGVALGIVPGKEAFSGFSHPAVITVAAVLAMSRGLTLAGGSELLASWLLPGKGQRAGQLSLTGVGALVSSVMNNVGALALLMPLAIRSHIGASRILMPLAFATILGGLITLIGTPPNLIVAAARGEALGEPFLMFDYAPVGLAAAAAGVLFIALAGRFLLPKTRGDAADIDSDAFQMEDYLAEARIAKSSRAIGKTIAQLDAEIAELDVKIIGLIRNGRLVPAVPRLVQLIADDILMIEAVPQDLRPFMTKLGLEAVDPGSPRAQLLQSDEVGLVEAVVMPGSRLEGRSVLRARLQRQYGINLLAVSRQGTPYRGRLRAFRFAAGDVLLLQGEAERLRDVVSSIGCLPLAERGLTAPALPSKGARRSILIFAAAVALGAVGLLPIEVAVSAGALSMVLVGIMHIRQVYEAIDWSVIVLLGALLPLGDALESSGATGMAAELLLAVAAGDTPAVVLAGLMIMTVAITNVLNNAATAVLMAPLSIQLADNLSVNPDPFLMGVAISASSAFMTPIGHQNNAIVMGPGGYQFGDYWRMGLPLTVVVMAVSFPMILWVWPFYP
jgi:di/tricarboxylate transporter